MRKSFSTLLLAALCIAFGAAFGTVHAAEPTTAGDRLAGAKKYYTESFITGYKVGIRLSGGKVELTPARIAAARQAIGEWLDKDMIPFLQKNGILDEWVKMQFDADVRKANQRAAEAKSIDELGQIASELEPLLKIRYPNLYAKVSSPEGMQLMQKLQTILMNAVTK